MKTQDDKAKVLLSNQEWIAWGRLDPLYAVASLDERAQSGSLPWTEEQFYKLGASDWELFRSEWEQYGVRYGTCVEIGCGAGRLTTHIARFFKQYTV